MTLRPLCLRTTASIIVALLGACTTQCMAQSTQSQTSNVISTQTTDWTGTLTVPQFNSSQGTLTSVQVTLNWNSYQALSATNTDSTTEEIYATDNTSVTMTMPNSDAPLVGTAPTLTLGSETTNEFGEPVASGSLAVGATDSAGPTTTTSTTAVTLTDSTDLASFTGTGNISFPVGTATQVFETEDGGNISWSVTTQAGASVTVVYTYTPTPSLTTLTGCITGALFDNKCGDGFCGHTGEGGLKCGGCKVNICDCLGNFVCCVLTASDGTFCCDNLKPCCTYWCCLDCTTLPSGYCLSKPCCSSLPPGCWPSACCPPACCVPACCPSFQWPSGCCPTGCDVTNPCNILSVTTPPTGCTSGINFPCKQPICSGSYTSYCQTDWQSNPLLCLLKLDCLDEHYCAVYPPDKCCQVGCLNTCWFPNGPTNCCLFNSAPNILCCFTQTGNCCPLPLIGCLLNPKCTTYGTLCGEVLACKLNCDFSDAGIFHCDFKKLCCQSGPFKGCTVEQCCNAGQCYLGGCCCLPCAPCPPGCVCLPCVPNCTPEDLCTCLHNINCCYGTSGTSSGNGFCK